ncbi:MAG TPA: SCO family protein [Oligoflexus sp.]|uniref:SCO family protein n=1 Tax=Oligoflexus sp. TaxID=1971216 RepID=UPI002D7F7B38|nr:SCO family protein [Oligoflexus sp.]HET9239315.1 SCO family protein [Oligoflexus sp.]
MQALGDYKKIAWMLLVILNPGCKAGPDVFETAIARHKATLVDQVNSPATGLPYFTVETLNPVWQLSAATPIVTMPALKLTDQDGKVRDSSLFDERITVIGFFFASCSGFCPFLVEGMKKIEKETEAISDKVRFVAFSVNPEQDTPARLKAYAKERGLNTDKTWTLLTGDRETIYSLAKKTLVSQVFRRASAANSFVHSEHLYVIDGQRHLRSVLNGTRVDVSRDAKMVIRQLANPSELTSN